MEIVHQGRVLHQVRASPSSLATKLRRRHPDSGDRAPSGRLGSKHDLDIPAEVQQGELLLRGRRPDSVARHMRALVVTSNPATAASEPETPAAALSDLGCEVVAVGYDVDQLPEDIELQRPSVVVVDAGAHLEVGRAAIRRVREVGLAGRRSGSAVRRGVPPGRPGSRGGRRRLRAVAGRGARALRAHPPARLADVVVPRRRAHQDRGSGHRRGRGRGGLPRPRAEAAAPGVPAAEVPGRAAGPRVQPRAAAVPRLGLSLRGRHAHRRHPRPPPARQAGPRQRDDRDRAPRRLQAARARPARPPEPPAQHRPPRLASGRGIR